MLPTASNLSYESGNFLMMIIAIDASATYLPFVVQNFRGTGILARSAEGGGQGERAADHGRPRRRLSRTARIGAQDLRALSRRLLAQVGGGAGLPDRVYRRADPRRVPRFADPRGIWRIGIASTSGRGDP